MIKIIKAKLEIFKTVLDEIPEIRYVGDPILRQQTQTVEISEGKKIGDKLGKVLLHYRRIAGFGRGWAAPQIGLNKAVFVTFVENKLQTFINPIIVEKSKETNFYKELCLSSGIMTADVRRPKR